VDSKYLITGGTGFIGAAVVRRLVAEGAHVRVLDNSYRGRPQRLAGMWSDVELVDADIREADAVGRAVRGMDHVVHMAYINGTELFYQYPELVLDVGTRGMLNVLDACRTHGVGQLTLTSSSEVYQTPPSIPTPEDVPLVVPDVLNPRYSYGGGKLISELLAINWGRSGFERVMICRPHNVYGPDMGWRHVLPQLILRILNQMDEHSTGPLPLLVRGSGEQSRAFIHIDDFTEGMSTMLRHGRHLHVYNIGNPEEIQIREVVHRIGVHLGRVVELQASEPPRGETQRRCPDISRLRSLGFEPHISLDAGLPSVIEWYRENRHRCDEQMSHPPADHDPATYSW